MLDEDSVADRIVGFVALECQVLFQDIDVVHVANDLNSLQKLEQLLVANLLRALRHRVDLSLELRVLQLELVPQGL